jgi:hypothetical protein
MGIKTSEHRNEVRDKVSEAYKNFSKFKKHTKIIPTKFSESYKSNKILYTAS